MLYGLATIMSAFQVVLQVKNLPDNVGRPRDTGLIPGLGRSPGEPELVFLPGESPWTEEPGGIQSMRLQKARHD